MFDALSLLHFIRPWWLVAIVPAVVVAWLWARRSGGDSHWETSIEPQLLAVLLEPGARQRSRRLPWLLAAALSLGAVGLAGPTWERLPQPVERKTDALVVLFDLSLSMFAEDIAPSRLVRARQKIADVLRRREEGFTALVAYAGDAHAVVPLTDDTRTIENLLGALRPDMMPVLGSDLAQALEQAETLFANAGVGQGRILVITDAIDALTDATERRDPNFPISILGVGTEAGATIPLDFVNQPGQVLRSNQGEAIVASLDSERLRTAATQSYGRYHTLTLADDDIDHLLGTPLPGQDETEEIEREFDTWADRGFWLAVLLLPVLLTSFRRGALALLPILLLPPPTAEAGVWEDLWQRRDQQAYQALREGAPETAAALFEEDTWRAAALYRSDAFAEAAAGFRRQETTTGLYNLGNALARQQQYQAAIDAYDAVLDLEPGHDDARFNKALVERIQEEQSSGDDNEQSSQQQGGDQPEDDMPPQSDMQQGEENQDQGQTAENDGEPAQPEDQEGQPQPGEASQDDEMLAASRDEKRDALEQWLRRVPDDPGGLLRRKFQYETNQRLRRGDYRSRETEKIW